MIDPITCPASLQHSLCAVGVLCITEFKKKSIKEGQVGGVGGALKERERGGCSLGWTYVGQFT